MVGFGIDFGTTNSVAAAFNGEKTIPFLDSDNRPHPSVLWYQGSTKPIVGREAKDQIKNFGNTSGNKFIRSIKSHLKEETEFEIFGKDYQAWKIASEIFSFLKEHARKKDLNYPDLNEAVVTIPLYFDGQQRKAIRKAAEHAGIWVKHFIHEPFAAVIGYLFAEASGKNRRDKKSDWIDIVADSAPKYILVFDWGGGTLDITLVRSESGTIYEVNNQGYPGRSGDHFDEILMMDVLDRFQKENNINPTGFRIDPGIASILSHDIEFAKIDLSDQQQVSVTIPQFYSENDRSISLRSEITRKYFESLIHLDIQDAMSLVEKVLHDSRVQASQVGVVLLIGGTSQIPLLDRNMRDTFGTAKVCRISNADTVIAEGAAIISYYDWQPFLVKPLCVQLSDQSFYTIFDKGTILKPETAEKEISFFCTDNRQSEGFLILADQELNRYITRDKVLNIPISKTLQNIYVERVISNFKIDSNIVLNVSAKGSIKGVPIHAEFHDLCYGLRFV